jgi:phytoene/squalene synthetase
LQVIEHLQDIAEDHGRGRVYLPVEDQQRFGVDEASLSQAAAPGGPLRGLIAYEAARAGQLLSAGAPLARTLPLRPRIAIAGFVAGGRAALAGLTGGTGAGPGAGASSASRKRALAGAFPRAFLGR